MTRDGFFTPDGGPVKPWGRAGAFTGRNTPQAPKTCSGIRGAGYATTEKLAYSRPQIW